MKAWENQGLVKADQVTKYDTVRRLGNLVAKGATNLYGGIIEAIYPNGEEAFQRAWRESIDTMYLLTDGAPTAAGREDVLRRKRGPGLSDLGHARAELGDDVEIFEGGGVSNRRHTLRKVSQQAPHDFAAASLG